MLDDRLPGIAREAGRDRRLGGDGEGAGLVRARRRGRRARCRTSAATSAGTTAPGGRTSTRSRSCSSGVRPGMRVLEVGAAKAWAAQHLVPRGVEYVATDILADPNVGLGRGAFYAGRVGPFGRVQADGEHLPFADGAFDLAYCVAALHHALDLGRMVSELARVTRRGGTVAALNEGTRALRASGEADDQAEEKGSGSTSTCTRCTRTCGRSRGPDCSSRGSSTRGRRRPARPPDRREAAPAPRRRPAGRDLVRADLLRLLGRHPLRPEAPVAAGRPAPRAPLRGTRRLSLLWLGGGSGGSAPGVCRLAGAGAVEGLTPDGVCPCCRAARKRRVCAAERRGCPGRPGRALPPRPSLHLAP